MKIKKEKIKKIISFFLNPKLLLCLLIGWIITNGWAYLGLFFGTLFKIKWLAYISGAYMSFLWFPFTPEKIMTVVIAIALLKLFFPKDKKTLAVLTELKEKIKQKQKKKPSTE